MSSAAAPRLQDLAPDRASFLEDVLGGLRRPRKELPCKWLYDARGSELFERICELDEYYPTRTELGILRRRVDLIARLLGPRCLLVEYGTGSGVKTELLLEALERPAAYVPVDIARDALRSAAAKLAARHPGLPVLPVCADYTQDHALPAVPGHVARRVVFFPGSTIGNFGPAQSAAFLEQVAALCGRGGGFLVGIDLDKDRATLERAYDDAWGVTAAFNRNLLARINRELGGDFVLERFRHRAIYDEGLGRIEMHLVSEGAQSVTIAGRRIAFEADESILTECSYKYTLEGFREQAQAAGLRLRRSFTDPRAFFAVLYLEVA